MSILATVVGIHCSLCDATGRYVLDDGRQTRSNQLRKIGWVDIGDHHLSCPNHTPSERFDFVYELVTRRKAESSRAKTRTPRTRK